MYTNISAGFKQDFKDYIKSVTDLANKLPQWDQLNVMRSTTNACMSLIEELGEICGLHSKLRIRKNWSMTNRAKLSTQDKQQIQEKLVDEISDFFWVLIATGNVLCLYDDDQLSDSDILNILESIEDFESTKSVYDTDDRETGKKRTWPERKLLYLLDTVNRLCFKITVTREDVGTKISGYFTPDELYNIKNLFTDVVRSFFSYVYAVSQDYDGINMEHIIKYNIQKLGKRYDSNGNRVGD